MRALSSSARRRLLRGTALAFCSSMPWLAACGASRPKPARVHPEAPASSPAPETSSSSARTASGRPVEASSARSPRSAAELRIELARLEAAYRYPEALRTLDALLALGVGDRDALERRRHTLESFVELAEASYARAAAAKTPAEEGSYLALIQSFWPGYRDVDERLLALRGARRQGAAGAEPGVPSRDRPAAPGGER